MQVLMYSSHMLVSMYGMLPCSRLKCLCHVLCVWELFSSYCSKKSIVEFRAILFLCSNSLLCPDANQCIYSYQFWQCIEQGCGEFYVYEKQIRSLGTCVGTCSPWQVNERLL